MNKSTLGDINNWIREELKTYYPDHEIKGFQRIIFGEVFQLMPHQVQLQKKDHISKEQSGKVKKIVYDLCRHKPIQYILGYSWFYDMRISVNEHVLIPRPETEELVDYIIKNTKTTPGRILDIGTGSGCIAISLAKSFNTKVTGMDISGRALRLASKNARQNKVKVYFRKQDIFKWSKKNLKKKFDLVVSNPPYVREQEKTEMNKNVLDYEPAAALFVDDSDPLIFYEHIARFSSLNLVNGGKLYVEINESLGTETINKLLAYRFKEITLIKDMNGKDRFIEAIK